jgi:hypothetical protein
MELFFRNTDVLSVSSFTCSERLKNFYPEDGSSLFLRNFGTYIQAYMMP